MRRTKTGADNLQRSLAWILLVPWGIVSCENAPREPEQTVEIAPPPPTTGTIQVRVASPGAQDRSWPAPPDGCEGGRTGQLRTNPDGHMEGVAVWISERLEEESEESETEEEDGAGNGNSEEQGSPGEDGNSEGQADSIPANPAGRTGAPAFFALEDCRPVPTVQVVPGNSELEIANRDNIDHGLELGAQTSDGPWGTAIDLGPQSTGVLTLPEEGLVHIQCPTESCLPAVVVVTDQGGLTGPDGTLEFENLDPATYELGLAHPSLGTYTARLTVAAGVISELDVRLEPLP